MKDKYFLDTNIFVYTFDSTHPVKQKKAEHLVQDALKHKRGVISYQVVQEFLNVATKKFQHPMNYSEASLYYKQVLAPLCEFYSDDEFYQLGLDIKFQMQFSYYDSLIVSAALRTHCRVLYSEDLQQGQKIRDLVIRNPFE